MFTVYGREAKIESSRMYDISEWSGKYQRELNENDEN